MQDSVTILVLTLFGFFSLIVIALHFCALYFIRMLVYMQAFHNALNETLVPFRWHMECGEVGAPLPRCRR